MATQIEGVWMLHLLMIAWKQPPEWHQQTVKDFLNVSQHSLSNDKQIAPTNVKITY